MNSAPGMIGDDASSGPKTGRSQKVKLQSAHSSALNGQIEIPGDKSISHRALIFGGLAEGRTEITGLLEGDDVLRTAGAMRAFGATVTRTIDAGARVWQIDGTGRWQRPEKSIYFGNAGTGVRLVMGAAAGRGVGAIFDGDASLRSRPMQRVMDPLAEMGAVFSAPNGTLPVSLKPRTGAARGPLTAIDYTSPVASAQVKSAVLLAALGASGTTRFREITGTRDHTERLMRAFGINLEIMTATTGGQYVSLAGGQSMFGCRVDVPGDPSSAAFFAAAAAVKPGSDVTIKRVLMNPLRVGFFDSLREMGADIEATNQSAAQGEEIADLRIRYAPLNGIEVPATRAAAMIDEYPILAIVAAFARGETYMPGIGELRVKESDRIASVEAGLRANGVSVESGTDWLRVTGAPGDRVAGGGTVATNADHRIAMSFLVMGAGATRPVTIDDASMIATSFPNFVEVFRALGGQISQP